MPSAIETQLINNRIYATAKNGTPKNPRGLPDPLAQLLIAQAKHETGHYTSDAFLKHNNAFGYSYVPGALWQSGPGLVADNGLPVANYATLEKSVAEIVDYIYRRVLEGKFPVNLESITTPEQYARYLKDAGFFTDTLERYAAGMRKYLTQVDPLAGNEGWFILGLLAVSGGALWYHTRKGKKKRRRKKYTFG